jgi:signal transduction histidine kinase
MEMVWKRAETMGDQRVLVLAPVGRDAELIHRVLAQASLKSVTCGDLAELRAEVPQGIGVLVFTEEILSAPVIEGLKDLVARQPAWSDLPMVILLKKGRSAERALVYQMFGDKAMVVILERPVFPAALVSVLQSLLQARRRQYQMRDLLDRLALQNEGLQREVAERTLVEKALRRANEQLQQEIADRKNAESERERLLIALVNEQARLEALTQTLEERVKERTHQVRALAARLSLAEHQERKRVSQILHDHVQQMLYGLQWRVYLTELNSPGNDMSAIQMHLGEMKGLIDEAIDATRTLSVELSPPILENEGLPEAIAWLASHMKEIHGINVLIDVYGDCRIVDQNLRTVLFQIVRELLFNVVKHAQADQAYVTLRRENGTLLAKVRDEGVGFDVKEISARDNLHTGLGLFSIRERLDLFGGEMKIDSKPHCGTEILIFLLLSEREQLDSTPAGEIQKSTE